MVEEFYVPIDKMSTEYYDCFVGGHQISECCGASVYEPVVDGMAICCECKEWSMVIDEESGLPVVNNERNNEETEE